MGNPLVQNWTAACNHSQQTFPSVLRQFLADFTPIFKFHGAKPDLLLKRHEDCIRR